MQKKYQIVGLGNALVDILANISDALLTELQIVKGSMQLCDLQRSQEIYTLLPPTTQRSGGSAANTMSGIAALGGRCAFMGMVGDDELGKIFTHDMQSMGIDFTPPLIKNSDDSADKTGRCLVLVSDDAERTMFAHLGISSHFSDAHIEAEKIKQAEILYLEGYLFDGEENKRAFYRAADIAKKNGCQVALSLSDSFCVDRHRDDFLAFITNSVDILFANKDELLSLYQENDHNKAVVKAGAMVETSFMTCGGEGVIIHHDGGFVQCDAYPVHELIDTTGAGDQFAAGVLYALTQGKNTYQAAQLGTLLASSVISHYGGRLQEHIADIKEKYAGLLLKNL